MKNDEYINDPELTPSADPVEDSTDNLTLEDVEESVLSEGTEDTAGETTTEAGATVTDTESPSLLVPDDIFGYSEAEAELFGKDDDDEIDNDDSDEYAETEDAEAEENAENASTSEIEESVDTDPESAPTENTEAPKTPSEEKPRRIDSLFDFIELFVFTLAAVFIITSFFFRYSTVEGGSMKNTLEDGEKLILSSFLYEPKAGDVVVVQDRSTELKDPIVKRVIAVGGQTVKITRTTVYVDGVALVEDYVYTKDYYNPYTNHVYYYDVEPCEALEDIVIGYEEGVYYEILVPDGEIFVMGDHRNNSKDSRSIGTLHEDAIIGKVVLRFAPFDKFGKID